VSNWLAVLPRALDAEPAVIRVTLASVLGSAPRDAGTSMLVGKQTQYGSIGGGNLEFKAVEIARSMLRKTRPWQVARFPLGPALAQCCGGFVELWFERIEAAEGESFLEFASLPGAKLLVTAATRGERLRRSWLRRDGQSAIDGSTAEPGVLDAIASMASDKLGACLVSSEASGILVERLPLAQLPLFVFGAGHVGSALIPILSGLRFAVTWVDSREEMFPQTLPANVIARPLSSALEEVGRAPAGAAFAVLTHDHALDYELCRAILLRGDFRFAGLIGSQTKAARFAHRFAREGIPAEVYTRLHCPIGIDGIVSKYPSAIAVSIAAQLLSLGEDWQGHSNRRAEQDTAESKFEG